MSMSSLEKAIALAVENHAGQTQKNGDPYILHPLHLMCQMRTERERLVAVLHDVVEDTKVTLDDLRGLDLDAEVLEAIALLTHDSDVTYEAYIEQIRPNALARRIKLADLEHNMDTRRLPQLDEDGLERIEKYYRAWKRLDSAESDIPRR